VQIPIGVVLLLLALVKAAGVLHEIVTGPEKETTFLVKQALYAAGFAVLGVALMWPRSTGDEPPDEDRPARPA
jgi:hypothetical protein